MIKRYIACTPPGVLITASLLLLMQQLINTGEPVLMPTAHDFPVLAPARVPPPPPPTPRDRQPAPIPPPLPVPGGRPVLPFDTPVISTSLPAAPFPQVQDRMDPDGPPWSDSALVSLVRVEPVYPRRAATLGLEGTVLLRFDVGADGLVSNAEVLQSSHALFNDPALRAASKFRYKPRVVDGVAVATPGVQTVFKFEMKK